MFRRQHAIVLFCTMPILALVAGCEDDTKATPQVIFDGRIELGSGNECSDIGGLFTIGDFGNQALTPPQASRAIKDGEAFEQGAVAVACSVTSAGADEFNVDGSISLTGATGGFFRLDGKLKTTGEQQNIHVIVSSKRSNNTYEQFDRMCTVRYQNTFQGVAAGRVWGEVTCPHAENRGAQKTCEIIAQFRFENCSQ